MKSQIALLQAVLTDVGTGCRTSTSQDLKKILARVEHEGMSFLTISLPNFGKDFERSLDQGFVARNLFQGFSWKGGLPKFLSGFLELVFNRETGRLLDEPSVEAIRAVRQVTLMFGKIHLPCHPKRVERALRQYIQTDEDVRLRINSLLLSEPDRLEDFSRVGRLLWADFFSSVDSRVYNESIMPKHGPGATADKLRGNAKYNQLTWTLRLENAGFRHWEHIIPSESFLDRTDGVTILEPGKEIPVKVITVPKTLKTPRIIAIEPTCMQYMQQGVLAMMVQEMPRFDNTRNLVMFERQEPNQRLAQEGSINGSLATLDLSEASDRVSNEHVRLLLANHRALRDVVDATRSRKAHVSDLSTTVDLAKFASMGSALCFPMEALVFATIVFVGIERALGRRLTVKDVNSLHGRVRVYGDDIIVPTDYVHFVVEELEAHGLRVNSQKSFWTGRFRESCGKEYYAGHDVTVARCKHTLPDTKRDAQAVESMVKLRNNLFHRGFSAAVDFLDDRIKKLIPFPIVTWVRDDLGQVVQTSPLLGRHTWDNVPVVQRMSSTRHVPLVKGVVVESKIPTDKLDDFGALMKHFLKEAGKPFQDEMHLERAGRPVSSSIKHRWCPP